MADLLLMVSLEGVLVDYDVMAPALTMWWEGGQLRRRPHFVDDVPAEVITMNWLMISCWVMVLWTNKAVEL